METFPAQVSTADLPATDKPSALDSTATATSASASSSGADITSRQSSRNPVCSRSYNAFGFVAAGQARRVTVEGDDTKPLLCEICAGDHDSSGDDEQPCKHKWRYCYKMTMAVVCFVAASALGGVVAGSTKPGQAFLWRTEHKVENMLPKQVVRQLPQLKQTETVVIDPSSPHVGICSVLGCGKNALQVICSCQPGCEEQGMCCPDYPTECSPKANLSDSKGSVDGGTKAADGNAKEDHASTSTSSSPALPTNLTEELLGRLQTAKGPIDMKFYLYRAQSDAEYLPENINAADLPGVLWYLHNEIVVSTPRKYDVTRILRFEVTMKNTQDLYSHIRSQFGPYVAFDMGRCTVPNCEQLWDKYGYVVGCQTLGSTYTSATTGKAGAWYSLPGPCPDMAFNAPKTDQCILANPGGSCDQVTGERSCTFHVEHAGEIRLDELVGIQDYMEFRSSGKQEYSVEQDQGIGISFWDEKNNPANCARRVRRAQELFHKHYPERPVTLAEPPCR